MDVEDEVDGAFSGLPDVVTVEEAAAALEVSVATVRRLCASGELQAEKAGKQWVIPRRLVEVRRPRRRPPGAAGGTSLDLVEALRHVRETDLVDHDIVLPDLLKYRDQLADSEHLLADARLLVSGALAASGGVVVELPKSAFFTRPTVTISLPERIAYQAAVASLAKRSDPQLPECVYGGRVDTSKRRFLKPGVGQWLVWKTAVKKAIVEGRRWMVKTDLTAYFETIKHATLLAAIESQNPDPIVLDALRRFLRAWAVVPGQGIPQGPNASRFLQNLYFQPIDDEMRRGPWSYFRYMDDIRILGRTRKEAVDGIRVLERECRRRGLLLSAQKTKLLEGEQALADWEDLEVDGAQYQLDIGDHETARKQLRHLLKASIVSDRAVERRRFKFSLWRLFKLRDREPIATVLKRLEDLAPAAQLVAVYLAPWIASALVEREITQFLNDQDRNISPYLEAWLMALMLDRAGQMPNAWADYARRIVRDHNQPVYLRGLAANVLSRARQTGDLDWIRGEVRTEHDPSLLRAYSVALWRVGELDPASSARVSSRHPLSANCIAYLKKTSKVPSLVTSADLLVPQ